MLGTEGSHPRAKCDLREHAGKSMIVVPDLEIHLLNAKVSENLLVGRAEQVVVTPANPNVVWFNSRAGPTCLRKEGEAEWKRMVCSRDDLLDALPVPDHLNWAVRESLLGPAFPDAQCASDQPKTISLPKHAKFDLSGDVAARRASRALEDLVTAEPLRDDVLIGERPLGLAENALAHCDTVLWRSSLTERRLSWT